MSNAATAQTALNIRVGGAGPVTPYVCTFDTTGSDLTIVTPATGKMAAIVGAFMSETSASNITFKSGTTTLVIPELAANQGILLPIGNNILLATQPGEALKVQVSVAVSYLLLFVVQGAYFDLTGS